METIWRRGPIARHEIAKLTGLTGPSITRLTRDLEERGLIFDWVQREGVRGQPVRPLSLAREGAYAFGVNFSHSFMDVGLVDLAGNLVTHEKLPLKRPEPRLIVSTAREALQRQLEQVAAPLDRIIGAGFSLPGDFQAAGRKLHAHVFFPELAGVDFAELMASEMPVPMIVENDAASAAVGERVHGAGGAYDSFLYVHIGHGVGGGLVLDGGLHRGAHGNAGMIGTLYPMGEPRPSGQDLFETLKRANIRADDFDDLDRLNFKDPVVAGWLDRAAAQLSDGLYVPARILDPQAIIIGGRLPPLILMELFQRIQLETRFDREPGLPRPVLLLSKLGSYAGVVGAASVCFFRAFFAAG